MKLFYLIMFVCLPIVVSTQEEEGRWRQVAGHSRIPNNQSLPPPREKWRWELKTLLHEYVRGRTEQSSRGARQESSSYNCIEPFGQQFDCASQAGKLDSFNNKKLRLESFKRTVRKKREKAMEDLMFEITAELLNISVGGNISQPLCPEAEHKGKNTTEIIGRIDHCYNFLYNCSVTVGEDCKLNETLYSNPLFEECEDLKKKINDKASECDDNLLDQEARCRCWEEANAMVNEFKKFGQGKVNCHDELANVERFMRTTKKKKCVKTFQSCKKLEDECIDVIHACAFQHMPIITSDRLGYRATLDEDEDDELEARFLEYDEEFEEEDDNDDLFEELSHMPDGSRASVEYIESQLIRRLTLSRNG